MTVHLTRVALATAPHAHALSLPAPSRKRCAVVEIVFVEIARILLIAADEQAAHDGDDAGHRAGDRHRMLRLLLRFHPAGELDDPLADRSDVDGSLAQNRVATERAQHALLQRGVAVEHALIGIRALIVL